MFIIGRYNGFRFCRGQIWLWQDPICGNKKDNISVPTAFEFERCIRYTRQVLIIQNMHTVGGHSVLVIPFSGHEHKTLYSVAFNSDNDTSYALPQLIFPADVNQLVKYIGVADEHHMESIDNILQYMMLQNDSSDLILGPNVIPPSEETYARARANNPSESSSATNKPKRHEKKRHKKRGNRNKQYNRREFKYQETYEDEIAEAMNSNGSCDMTIEEAHVEYKNYVQKSNHTKWDEQSRRDFVQACKRDGLDATAIFYHIKLNTAEKYFRTWESIYGE